MNVSEPKFSKIIRDPVHGYIPITGIENEILQLPVLNRLHRVRQMSLVYLIYPGATNSRFTHSLGTMHISSKIIMRVFKSLNPNVFKELFPGFEAHEAPLIVKIVRLAALLHDVGHGPYSHSSEPAMTESLKIHRPSELDEAKRVLNKDSTIPIHEFFSYKLVTKGEVSEILEKEGIREEVASLIQKSTPEGRFRENPVGCLLLRRIVSSQLDADRMDYLIRDAQASGVTYGAVDVERIILNLEIRKDRKGNFELAIHKRAQSAIEDMLDARFKMYKWLYNHHLVVATEALLEKAIENAVFYGLIDDRDLHWETFDKGLMEDDTILRELAIVLSRGSRTFEPFRGLLDRRYLPISLLKRSDDEKKFINDVKQKSGRTGPASMIKEKIEQFLSDPTYQSNLQGSLNSQKGPLNKAIFLVVNAARSPYSYLKEGDTVWLFDDAGQLTELTDYSTYFRYINSEWESFRSLYVSYVIPGYSRNESRQYERKIWDIFADSIAAVP